ncbi:hypothetical protein [Streptomyces decoyicus]|uniref:hypothetical protein n=1 Tax=Streptomyces decoyicus TaxID=249567 RepID=UPI0033AAF2A6
MQTITREEYEERKQQLDATTTAALQEFEHAKNRLAEIHKDCLGLEAEWTLAQARAAATPGMWQSSLGDPVMVAAAKVLTDAGHPAALIGGTSTRDCRDTGFFLTHRRGSSGEPVEAWHLVDGSDRQANGLDAWYQQLDAYRDVFRAAGWSIEWHVNGTQSVYATPPDTDRDTEQGGA